ncbi:MAG: PAS domain S-box protein, partial [Deltaproteobacteria bacterium]
MRDEPRHNAEKLCQAIFDQRAVGVAQLVSRTGELLRINKKYCDILGYTRREMEQSTFRPLTHPEDFEVYTENMHLLLEGKIREFSQEKRYYRKDGSVAWVNLTVSPLWETGEEPSCHIEVAQDITEMKRTEEALERAHDRPDKRMGEREGDLAGREKSEEALRTRERLLTRALALMRVSMWVWDIERDECHISDEILNFHCMGNPAPTMEQMFSLVPEEDRLVLENAFQRALDGTKPYHVEHRVIRPDNGEICWVRSCAEVMRDESGKPVRMEGALQEITERKLAETELVKSEERLRLAMAATTDGVWDWNITTDEVYKSPSFYTMLGYEPNELPLRHEGWVSRIHADDLPRVKAVIKECMVGVRERFEIEFRMLHKTSKTIWILSRGEVVEHDRDGKPVRMVGTHTDMTFRKETEEELRASKERYRAVIDNAGVGIDVLDRDGRILQVNQALSDMLGYNEKELGQLSFTDITHPDDREISQRKLEALSRGEIDSYRLEKRYIKNDGSILWGDLSTAVIRDSDGEHIATVGIIADVTERKKAEEALRESEARVRMKLDSIISPDGDIGILELADVIDVDAIQAIMDDFYSLTNIGVGIVDLKGHVFVSTGWQDICTRFHRVHPESMENCRESDIQLSSGVDQGSFKLYRCKNNMWDIATPLIIGGKHLGNLFLGQFLFEDESPDYDVFRAQARKYGFDEEEYLAALERVPRWSRETVDTVMRFYTKMTDLLSVLSYSNIKLSRTLAERDRLVASVQEGEAKYRRLFANSPVGIISIDTGGTILEINPKLIDILGAPSVEATKATNMFRFAPLREYGFSHAFEKCIATGESFSVEAPYKSRWGKPTHLRVLLTPIIDEESLVQGCQAVVEDVTDRKRAEQALRESEERSRLVTNTIQDVFWMSTPGIEKMIYVSPGYEKIWGRSRASLYESPKSFLEAVLPEDRRRLQNGLHDHAEGRWNYEYRIIRPDGTVRWISDQGYPIHDERGQVRLMTGVARDITESKAAEEELQRNLNTLKQAEAMANLGYFERNWQTGEGYWSEGFYRILGRESGAAISDDDFMAYIHNDDRDK